MLEFFRKYNKIFFWAMLVPACLALGVSYTMVQVLTASKRKPVGYLFGKPVSPEEFYEIRRGLIDYKRFVGGREIQDAEVWEHLLLLREAQKLGLTYSKAELKKKIEELYKSQQMIQTYFQKFREAYEKYSKIFKGMDDKQIRQLASREAQKAAMQAMTFDEEKYLQIIQERKISIPLFEKTVGQMILIEKYKDYLKDTLTVPPSDLYEAYQKGYHSRQGEFLTFHPEKWVPKIEDLKEKEIFSFYLKNKKLFQIPEKYSLAFMVADLKKLKKDMKEPEIREVEKYFQKHKDELGAEKLTEEIKEKIRDLLMTFRLKKLAYNKLLFAQEGWAKSSFPKGPVVWADENGLEYYKTSLLSIDELKKVPFVQKYLLEKAGLGEEGEKNLFLRRLPDEKEGMVSPILFAPSGLFIYKVLKIEPGKSPRYANIKEKVRKAYFRHKFINEKELKNYYYAHCNEKYKEPEKLKFEYAYLPYKKLYQRLVKEKKISSAISYPLLVAYMKV
ncbi:MAG: hypothetical protein D6785_07830, partial [Planctomycetota bacterium]